MGDFLKEVMSEHNRCVEGLRWLGRRRCGAGDVKGGDMARGTAWKALMPAEELSNAETSHFSSRASALPEAHAHCVWWSWHIADTH